MPGMELILFYYIKLIEWFTDFCRTIELFFLYNKQNNTRMLGNIKLFLVLNRIFHSFALLTREISWSTLEINSIFPHIHVLFSLYSILYYKN